MASGTVPVSDLSGSLDISVRELETTRVVEVVRPVASEASIAQATAAAQAVVDAATGGLYDAAVADAVATVRGGVSADLDTLAELAAARQPVDALLTALAALTTAADRLIYTTGADQVALTVFTAAARTLLAAADQPGQRSAMGAAQAGANADITSLAGTATAPGIDFLAASTSIASAATVDLGALTTIKAQITGTATVTSFGTSAHRLRLLHFTGACTLTNSTALALPGGVNRAVAVGDRCIATSDASGNWTLWAWSRADGKAYTAPTSTDITDATTTGRAVLVAATAAAARTAITAAASGSNADITKLSGTSAAPGIDFLAAATTVASAATVDLGAQTTLKVAISGTTAITSFGTAAHTFRLLTFQGALTLTYNATTLILPGAANIVTAAGDTAIATSDASGNWTVRHYQRASGKPLTGPASTDITDSTATGRSVLTAATAAAGATALGLGTGNGPTFASLTATGAGTFSGTVAAPLFTINGALPVGPPAFTTRSVGTKLVLYPSIAASSADFALGIDNSTFWCSLPVSNASNFFKWYGGTTVVATLDAVGNLSVNGAATFGGAVKMPPYTVATLPTAGIAGRIAYATNGRAYNGAGALEAAGSGTGTLVTDSGTAWRVAGTNQTVQA